METNDPYRASAAPVAPALQKLHITSAGKWRRFFNYLIDLVVYTLLVFLKTLAAYFVWGEQGIAWGETHPFLDLLLNLTIMTAYYTVMEGAFGFTIGKLVTDTRTVDEYGRTPGFGRALKRSLARLIPFEAFSLLFADDSDARGWHDTMAKTYVIRRPKAGQPVGEPRASIAGAFANGVQGRVEPVFEKPL